MSVTRNVFSEIETILYSCRSYIETSDTVSILTTLAHTLPDMCKPVVDEGHRDRAIDSTRTGLLILTTLIKSWKTRYKEIGFTLALHITPGDGVAGPFATKIDTDEVSLFYQPTNILKVLQEREKQVYRFLSELIKKGGTIYVALNVVPGNGTSGIGSIRMPLPLHSIPETSVMYIEQYRKRICTLVSTSRVYYECNYCGNGISGAGVVLCG
jgi:hypothetical protein